MKLKVKKLLPNAKLPTRAYQFDLGYDLYAAEDIDLQSGEFKLVRTGLCMEADDEMIGFITRDRSSMACKGIFSHAGVIDAGYRGEIKILLENVNKTNFSIAFNACRPYIFHFLDNRYEV